MLALYVTVRLHDTVVDDRVVEGCEGLRLGDDERAVVSFPGADLLLRRVDDALLVRGRRIGVGECLCMELGAVQVTLEVLCRRPGLEGLWQRVEDALGGSVLLPDLRLLLATAAIALGASFFEAAGGFVSSDPVASHSVQALRQAIGRHDPAARNAQIQAPDPDDGTPLVDEPAPLVTPGERPPALYRVVD